MASSIIHLAVTNELTKKHKFKDINRLKFGAILPDAGEGKKGHLNKYIWGRNKKAYDFELFRGMFGEQLKSDDLYLGYYLHLVQDICYRHFVYDKYHWNPMIPGNVEKLHKDYSIINKYVTDRYHLKNDLYIPEDFQKEKINDLCHFDVTWLMESMDEYFKEVPDEDIFFFTREMADEFVAEAVELCLKELKALDEGSGMIESYDNAWNNKVYSLLETTINTRDLGGYRIDGTDTYTQYGRIIRSDVVLKPSDKDVEFLRKSGITTVIDMRTAKEKARKPHGLACLEGFDYHDIAIEEGSETPDSLEAIPESYYKIAHASNISDVFNTIANAPENVIFNCYAGKDRSGVIASLLLWLCGVRKSDIVYDYMRTKENSKKRFELIHKERPELDMNIVIPNENNLARFMELIEENHGTVQEYFSSVGISRDIQEIIVCKMIS
ncbi:MAG: tyrosine-protein phosphatase [Butyrivibrio sp.]|nr:tyrosine-protein phosphatase [Butyrivibrio sp.]